MLPSMMEEAFTCKLPIYQYDTMYLKQSWETDVEM